MIGNRPFTTVCASKELPRLPLEGSLDLTYRCNNACHHCWLWLPIEARERSRELTFAEIRHIADDARGLGCRRWAISGGEPMLRPDFAEIFDYLTRRSFPYSLNTNGTLITPSIARMLTRKGSKMVALYGATAEVHDRVTRTTGSFDATLRGMAYLCEARAGFVVQLIPMRDNYHQFDQMVELARSLTPDYRVGAPWLWLSACGSPARNREIARQRLSPSTAVALDPPAPLDEGFCTTARAGGAATCGEATATTGDDKLFGACIASRRAFHIDPFGQMTFCSFVKDPAMRYDLRRGTFQEAWDRFIPSLADAVRGGPAYLAQCGRCELRGDCRWCAVYGYLEHRQFSAKVDYLCQVARENRRVKEAWRQCHRRYYEIAGVSVQVDADLPITDETFAARFRAFRVEGGGQDTISIHHHFELPDLDRRELGQEIYRRPPWAIYRQGKAWIYVALPSEPGAGKPSRVLVLNDDYTRCHVYNDGDELFREGGLPALTMCATDQIVLAPALAKRQAIYLHAAGMVVEGQGLLFAGHSGAGKSTIVTMLREEGEILCDDRMIVRRWAEGLRIHGTWSHGDVPDVSAATAPLRAILFLEQAGANRLVPIVERKEIARRLLCMLIKPLATADWWEKTLALVAEIVREVPAYRLQFDKSGRVTEVLAQL